MKVIRDNIEVEVIEGLAFWVGWYEQNRGVKYNLRTLGKRRQVANLGKLVGPRKRFILTQDEFEQVASTPLPMSHAVLPPTAVRQ